MSYQHEWKVGQMAYVSESWGDSTVGDLMKVMGLDSQGKPLFGGRQLEAYKWRVKVAPVVSWAEAAKLPGSSRLAVVAPGAMSEYSLRHGNVFLRKNAPAGNDYAILSVVEDPEPTVEWDQTVARLKSDLALERQVKNKLIDTVNELDAEKSRLAVARDILNDKVKDLEAELERGALNYEKLASKTNLMTDEMNRVHGHNLSQRAKIFNLTTALESETEHYLKLRKARHEDFAKHREELDSARKLNTELVKENRDLKLRLAISKTGVLDERQIRMLRAIHDPNRRSFLLELDSYEAEELTRSLLSLGLVKSRNYKKPVEYELTDIGRLVVEGLHD